MAANYPPFINSVGLIPKILDKIKEAQTPPRFTTDFLGSLGYASGSGRPFIPLAKRLGLLGSDGVPTDLYKSFRNPDQSKFAMKKAIEIGYKDVFARNEYAHKLDRKQLENLIVELTGLEKGSHTIQAIAGTFEALKKYADFDMAEPLTPAITAAAANNGQNTGAIHLMRQENENFGKGVGINLSYTINLVLPNTQDIGVFNAIFKSIRDNLLEQ